MTVFVEKGGNKKNMKTVEELEVEIKKGKEALAAMEVLYNAEQDESKIRKLEFKMSGKEGSISKLIDRQQKLFDKEAEDEEREKPKDKNAEEEDLDVCSECGGNLTQVGDEEGTAIFECDECHELFLDE